VFDACHIGEQRELVKALKASGSEVILDPNFAEMATLGRFRSATSKLPWANAERPWQPADFGSGRNVDTAKLIADFAMTQGANVVLAPTHLIDQISDPWRIIDFHMCEELRDALDRLGGTDVAIDYQLIFPSALLRDAQSRQALIADVGDLPIHNVWLRTSGFGATATGAGARHFIEAVRWLHKINRPLVADLVGGFAGLAVLAFGAAGGISHGIGQKESFRVNVWKRPPNGGGSFVERIYVAELDRHFKEDELNAIFGAKGGRSRFGCNDTNCCPQGVEDMVENAHAHFISQRSRQIDDLSKVPEARRGDHFLLRHLDPAIRSARHGARLKIEDPRVVRAIKDANSRLVRLRDALGDLHAKEGVVTRSLPLAFRGGMQSIRAIQGR
jgi:hypothetical protein